MALIAEEIFEFYLNLPSEVRGVIIDEMETVERCRFTRCSKICNKEVKASKNYIYGLELVVDSSAAWSIYIHVSFGDGDTNGCFLYFYDENGTVKISNYDGIELWRLDLGYPMSSMELAVEHFRNLLHFYQNKMKALFVHVHPENHLRDYDFGITNLNNLRGIEIRGDTDFNQFFSKLQRPLKFLSVVNCETLPIGQEVYEVYHTLDLPQMRLTNEQFRQISASVLKIHIGDLTEMDIHNFIQSWQNGTREKLKIFRWRIPKPSVFDKEKLFRLLGERIDPDTDIWRITVEVMQHGGERRRAQMQFFDVDDEEDENLENGQVDGYYQLVFDAQEEHF